MRIIDKTGPLHNPADRDHCLQYMVAVRLIHGDAGAEHYEDEAAARPADRRAAGEDAGGGGTAGTRADYLDPEKRSIANAVQVFFADGSSTEQVEVEYPLGHRRRRAEAIPLLEAKGGCQPGDGVLAGAGHEPPGPVSRCRAFRPDVGYGAYGGAGGWARRPSLLPEARRVIRA